MHTCITVDEIIRLLACELVASGGKATAVALARCCKNLEDPVLDVLWATQERLYPLLDTFAKGIWNYELETLAFERMPTTSEWARFKKYARRMRKFRLDISEEPIPSDVLSTLQLRTLNEPLFPSLKTIEFMEATADIIPFVPLFLSHKTTRVDIEFATIPPVVMVASMIINLPKLCPHMQSIRLQPLPEDETITSAVSEMLLTCNLDALRYIIVDSALTKEASQVVFQLHDLSGLWLVLLEPTPLPAVSLPNLTRLDVNYRDDHDWLQAFRGAKLSKLTEVSIHADCDRIGNFLEAFELSLASSASTLSEFAFYTSCSWNPSYYSLLSFKQLKELTIEFSCENGCSSSMDDETIITLAQAMPKLETLQLGDVPCQAPSNVTVQGLIALAHHCPYLFTLRIHFQPDSLAAALADEVILVPSPGKSHLLQDDCALATLEVGEIPLPHHCFLPVVLTLLRIFPRLLLVKYVNEEWKWVAETIRLSQQIGSLVNRSVSRFDPGNLPDNGQN